MITALLAAPPVMFVTLALWERLRGAPSPPTWGRTVVAIVGIEYCFATMTAFFFTHPRPHGERAKGKIVLRIPPWRRIVAASMLPVTALMFSAENILRGDVSLAAVVAVALAAIATLVVTSERLAVSTAEIERVAGIGRRHRIGWNEVCGLDIWQAGVRVHGVSGKSIHVPGLWMDGYPEFVALLLERAPAVLVDPLRGDIREMLRTIAALADPSRSPCRRAAVAKNR